MFSLTTGLATFNSAVGQLGNTIGILDGNPGTLVGLTQSFIWRWIGHKPERWNAKHSGQQ